MITSFLAGIEKHVPIRMLLEMPTGKSQHALMRTMLNIAIVGD